MSAHPESEFGPSHSADRPRSFDDDLFVVCDAPSVLAAILKNSQHAVKIVDLDGRVLAWNPACEHLYGWTAEEAIGEVLPHYPDSLRLAVVRAIRETASSGVPERRMVEATRRDGSTVGVDLTMVGVTDRSGNTCGVLSLASEVSGDSRFDTMSDELLSAVAQEITAPLTALQGAAQLMLTSDIAEDPERRAHVARLVADRCRQIGNLAEDLLASVGFLDVAQSLDVEMLDLVAVAREAAARHVGRERRAAVNLLPGLPSIRLLGDRARIAQAISTMLAIATDDARGAGVTLSVYRDDAVAIVETIQLPSDRDSHEARKQRLGQSGGVIGVGARLKLVERIATSHGGSFTARRSTDDATANMLSLRLPLAAEGSGS